MKIIGGNFKGKSVYFCKIISLRPTKNIVRKAFVDWLDRFFRGSCVLDLFAGTGILGFESLSRGATCVMMCEKNKQIYNMILKNKKWFGKTYNLDVKCVDSYMWIKRVSDLIYNIVILDPPYESGLLFKCFLEIDRIKFICKYVLIYFECNTSFILNKLPYAWILLKKKKTGSVYYYLAKKLT